MQRIDALTFQGHVECHWLGAKHCGSDEFSDILLRAELLKSDKIVGKLLQ